MKKLKKTMKRQCLTFVVNEVLFLRPKWERVEQTVSEYLENYEYDPGEYESEDELRSDVIADCRYMMGICY